MKLNIYKNRFIELFERCLKYHDYKLTLVVGMAISNLIYAVSRDNDYTEGGSYTNCFNEEQEEKLGLVLLEFLDFMSKSETIQGDDEPDEYQSHKRELCVLCSRLLSEIGYDGNSDDELNTLQNDSKDVPNNLHNSNSNSSNKMSRGV